MTAQDKKIEKKVKKLRFAIHVLNDNDLAIMYCIVMDEVILRDKLEDVKKEFNRYHDERLKEIN